MPHSVLNLDLRCIYNVLYSWERARGTKPQSGRITYHFYSPGVVTCPIIKQRTWSQFFSIDAIWWIRCQCTVQSHNDSAMAEHVLYIFIANDDDVDDAGTKYLAQQWTHDVVMLCSTRQLPDRDIWRLWSNRHHPLHICHWHRDCRHWNRTRQWVYLVDIHQLSHSKLNSSRPRPRLETEGFRTETETLKYESL